jgi:NitT/TauT family transport system permease protein
MMLSTDSVPTALEALRAVPDILLDRGALINILDSIRRMAIGLAAAVVVSIPLGLVMGRVGAVASFFNPC